MSRPRCAASILLLLTTLAPWTLAAEVLSVAEGEDWCAVANGASPGDEVALAPGAYTRPCTLRVAGRADAPITIRSADAADRARIAYTGATSNVIDVNAGAAHLILRDLVFEPTMPNIDAIKIKGGEHIRVENNLFDRIGGVSVSALVADTSHIAIVGNVFDDLQATGIYIGCQNGTSCASTDLLVEGNLILGVDSPNVGYGLQVKLNSWGVVRDNSIFDTKGPGIMIYGSNDGSPPSVVEGNWVFGSRQDAAINLSGGPVIARRNVVGGGQVAGIYAQNYQDRGLQRSVWIVHNTVLPGAGAGVRVQGWEAGANNAIANNAISVTAGQMARRPADLVADLDRGEVTCDATCFEGGGAGPWALVPASGGPLEDTGAALDAAWGAEIDFRGGALVGAPDPGAFERQLAEPGVILALDTPRPERGVPDPPGEEMGSGSEEMGPQQPSDMGSTQSPDSGGDRPGADMPVDSPDQGGAGSPDQGAGAAGGGEQEGCGCGAARGAPGGGGVMVLFGVLVAGLRRRLT